MLKASMTKSLHVQTIDAVKIKQDAKKASELESEKARLAVKQEIAELAMQAATKVVEKEVSPKQIKCSTTNFK